MGAPEGNQFWLRRSKHGRDKIFEDPEILWKAACEYFEDVIKNPWYINEAIKSGKDVGKMVKIPTVPPFTLERLCVFLDIDTDTFSNYSKKESYKDFFEVTTRISSIIKYQKFEGAAIGAYNANIIARDLGLKDTSGIELEDKRKPIDLSKLTDKELSQYEKLQSKVEK